MSCITKIIKMNIRINLFVLFHNEDLWKHCPLPHNYVVMTYHLNIEFKKSFGQRVLCQSRSVDCNLKALFCIYLLFCKIFDLLVMLLHFYETKCYISMHEDTDHVKQSASSLPCPTL